MHVRPKTAFLEEERADGNAHQPTNQLALAILRVDVPQPILGNVPARTTRQFSVRSFPWWNQSTSSKHFGDDIDRGSLSFSVSRGEGCWEVFFL